MVCKSIGTKCLGNNQIGDHDEDEPHYGGDLDVLGRLPEGASVGLLGYSGTQVMRSLRPGFSPTPTELGRPDVARYLVTKSILPCTAIH